LITDYTTPVSGYMPLYDKEDYYNKAFTFDDDACLSSVYFKAVETLFDDSYDSLEYNLSHEISYESYVTCSDVIEKAVEKLNNN
jgi:hypothetical protein